MSSVKWRGIANWCGQFILPITTLFTVLTNRFHCLPEEDGWWMVFLMAKFRKGTVIHPISTLSKREKSWGLKKCNLEKRILYLNIFCKLPSFPYNRRHFWLYDSLQNIVSFQTCLRVRPFHTPGSSAPCYQLLEMQLLHHLGKNINLRPNEWFNFDKSHGPILVENTYQNRSSIKLLPVSHWNTHGIEQWWWNMSTTSLYTGHYYEKLMKQREISFSESTFSPPSWRRK